MIASHSPATAAVSRWPALRGGVALLLIAVGILLAAGALRAFSQSPATPAPSAKPSPDEAVRTWAGGNVAIVPTTTVATGDRGGKFFGKAPDPARTRHYYIAAEGGLWDYLPAGRDVVCGKPLPPHIAAGRTAMKIRYVQYTDATFTARVMGDPRVGIMGPALRGVVGDTFAVTFYNKTDYPLSMHPHGVRYDKDSEGAFYEPKPGLGAAVGPNAKFTYVWHLDENSGPRPDEPSSKAWLYHSHVSGDEESNRGLVGFIIVTDPKRARPDGTPNDVDREMASLFMIFNESTVSEADEYAPPGTSTLSWAEFEEQRELGSRFGINGLIFGNHPPMEMNEGERVRWYLFGLGDEVDLHTAHWHGLRVTEEGRRRTDVIELLPASMKTADLVADNPGTWLFHCHVAEHMMNGMFAALTIHPRAQPAAGRAPTDAFFGLPQRQHSLRITRAMVELGDAADDAKIRLWGVVTVYRAFAVRTAPIRLQLGGKAVELTPGPDGTATAKGGRYRVTNSNQFGVVYDENMEWEAVLTGSEWLEVLRQHGLAKGGKQKGALTVPIEMHVGTAKHVTEAQFEVETARD